MHQMEEMKKEVLVRVLKDPQFKKLLLKNPRAAFKEMGYEIPQNFELQVVEDTSHRGTFVLPAQHSQVGELSDKELEQVSREGWTHCRNGGCWTF